MRHPEASESAMSPDNQFERNNLQVEDLWDTPGVAYWILHEEDFDQWWSMWSEEGVYEPYYMNWKADPGRKRVEMAYHYWKTEIENP